LALAFATVPILSGSIHYAYHSAKIEGLSPKDQFSAVLVQTAFPVEESMHFKNSHELFSYVQNEWKKILEITKKQAGKPINLIAIPELVVPFGTYTFIYNYDEVKNLFLEIFGDDVSPLLPPQELPLAYEADMESGKTWLVNNAFWAQSLANIFDASVVVGLEDAEDVEGVREYYSAAIHVIPDKRGKMANFTPERYAKRVLVPMGEYIPFSFCRDLAARYGVFGSFTAGKKAEVWKCCSRSFGLSICYEEMFGDMMRENRQMGADFLLNITSDAWFPHSKLIRQHLEHSRLRTVENGFPLVRACNTGITCVVDSLGRDVAVLGESDAKREDLSDSLYVTFPLYNYQTLYTRFGDSLILVFSLILVLLFFRIGR
jgi:apolipoprotein N-acyltransferase